MDMFAPGHVFQSCQELFSRHGQRIFKRICGLLPFPTKSYGCFPRSYWMVLTLSLHLTSLIQKCLLCFITSFSPVCFCLFCFLRQRDRLLFPFMVENVPSSSWDCFCLSLTKWLNWSVCISTAGGISAMTLTPVCPWNWTNGERTFILEELCKHLRGSTRCWTSCQLCKDGVRGFNGLLVCLRLWL